MPSPKKKITFFLMATGATAFGVVVPPQPANNTPHVSNPTAVLILIKSGFMIISPLVEGVAKVVIEHFSKVKFKLIIYIGTMRRTQGNENQL
ncbi:MAG: hypothetical protein PHI29_08820 [Gallionella sp.]|nr:hypothetical protein [Gallionella sp.]